MCQAYSDSGILLYHYLQGEWYFPSGGKLAGKISHRAWDCPWGDAPGRKFQGAQERGRPRPKNRDAYHRGLPTAGSTQRAKSSREVSQWMWRNHTMSIKHLLESCFQKCLMKLENNQYIMWKNIGYKTLKWKNKY